MSAFERVTLAWRALRGQLPDESNMLDSVAVAEVPDVVSLPGSAMRRMMRKAAYDAGLDPDWVPSRTSAELDLGSALLAVVRARRRHLGAQPHDPLPADWLRSADQVQLDTADLLFGVEGDMRNAEWREVTS